MTQVCDRETEQLRKEMPVFVMESEEVAKIECARFARLKHRDVGFPLVAPRRVDAVRENEISEPQRRDEQNHQR